jgi:phosphate transport system protein
LDNTGKEQGILMEKKMKHTEMELFTLKKEVGEMWHLVLSQLQKCKQAYLTGDTELSREVVSREKRVNSYELKIDSLCENYIALFAPVAVDLRLVLSLMKISGTLERIGDFASGIAQHVMVDSCHQVAETLKEDLKIETMFDTVISMLSDSFVTLESESTKLSGKILQMDDEVDSLYRDGKQVLAEYIQKDPNGGTCVLETFLVLRKIERIGDHCSNIVEEIVFYIDAKVLKHAGKFRVAEAEEKGAK